MEDLDKICRLAYDSSETLYFMAHKSDAALELIADNLAKNVDSITIANQRDLKYAMGYGLSEYEIESLRIDRQNIYEMCSMVMKIKDLKSPAGKILSGQKDPGGLTIQRVTEPIGVIGIIYGVDPLITLKTSAMCIKTGNSVLLNGSKGLLRTNKNIVDIIQEGLLKVGIPSGCVQLVYGAPKRTIECLSRMDRYINLLIAYGERELFTTASKHATVPVIWAVEESCIVYIDKSARDNAIKDVLLAIIGSGKSETVFACIDIKDQLIACLKSLSLHVNAGLEECIVIIPQNTNKGIGKISIKWVAGNEEAIKLIKNDNRISCGCIISEDSCVSRKFTNTLKVSSVYVNIHPYLMNKEVLRSVSTLGNVVQGAGVKGSIGLQSLVSSKIIVEEVAK